jgi:hypothetical protein
MSSALITSTIVEDSRFTSTALSTAARKPVTSTSCMFCGSSLVAGGVCACADTDSAHASVAPTAHGALIDSFISSSPGAARNAACFYL